MPHWRRYMFLTSGLMALALISEQSDTSQTGPVWLGLPRGEWLTIAAIVVPMFLAIGTQVPGVVRRYRCSHSLKLDFKQTVSMSEETLAARVLVRREVHLAYWVTGLEYPSGLQVGADHGTVGTPMPDWARGGITRFAKGTELKLPLELNLKEPLRGRVKLTAVVGDAKTVFTATRKFNIVE